MSKHWTILLWFMWLRIDRNYIPEQADEKTKAYNLKQKKSKKATNEQSIAMTFTLCKARRNFLRVSQVSASLLFIKSKVNSIPNWISTNMHTAWVFIALCSRNFQTVKLRLDFVEIWQFYRHSDFVWSHILANSNGPSLSFMAILETLNFEFW